MLPIGEPSEPRISTAPPGRSERDDDPEDPRSPAWDGAQFAAHQWVLKNGALGWCHDVVNIRSQTKVRRGVTCPLLVLQGSQDKVISEIRWLGQARQGSPPVIEVASDFSRRKSGVVIPADCRKLWTVAYSATVPLQPRRRHGGISFEVQSIAAIAGVIAFAVLSRRLHLRMRLLCATTASATGFLPCCSS